MMHFQKIQLEAKPAEFAEVADSTTTTDYFKYEGFMAINDNSTSTEYEPRASINWKTHTIPAIPGYETILATTTAIPPIPNSNTRLVSTLKKPFYMDSSTTMHISLCASDFVTFHAILPWAIKGVGGTSIQAVSIGQIRLQVQNQTEIYLKNVLYIPTSIVQLILISALTIGMHAIITFSRTGVTILDESSRTLLAAGPLILRWQLYIIKLQLALNEHTLTAAPTPVEIDTWHWCLRHANYQVVATMACNDLLTDMPSSSLTMQPKCDICILGKQTKTLVCKVWEEGRRAVERLQTVWIELAGPMNVQLYTRNKYTMDLVDNYMNMPWAIPLKSKSDVFAALQIWQKACKLEMGRKVGIYYMGHDGELV